MPLLKKAKPLLDEMGTGKNIDINDIFTDEMMTISHEMIVGMDDQTFEKSKNLCFWADNLSLMDSYLDTNRSLMLVWIDCIWRCKWPYCNGEWLLGEREEIQEVLSICQEIKGTKLVSLLWFQDQKVQRDPREIAENHHNFNTFACPHQTRRNEESNHWG